MVKSKTALRRKLITWYEAARRDLPWRQSADPYRVWISEIMLQQTRVAAVIPYYERFLTRFPDVNALAEAKEQDVLHAWAGLGYYSRARNLQKAAKQIATKGAFPNNYDEIRELKGIGDYTAAAIASISFQLPHAVLDGNVMRVLSRLDNDPSDIGSSKTKQRMQTLANELLDTKQPAFFNQAMMELGATVCLPKQPHCLLCPLADDCEARKEGTVSQLPVKLRKQEIHKIERTLLLIQKDGKLLLWRRTNEAEKLNGFYELPEPHHLPRANIGASVGHFRHAITNHDYRFTVNLAQVAKVPSEFMFISHLKMSEIPLSTTTRKALLCLKTRMSPEA